VIFLLSLLVMTRLPLSNFCPLITKSFSLKRTLIPFFNNSERNRASSILFHLLIYPAALGFGILLITDRLVCVFAEIKVVLAIPCNPYACARFQAVIS